MLVGPLVTPVPPKRTPNDPYLPGSWKKTPPGRTPDRFRVRYLSCWYRPALSLRKTARAHLLSHCTTAGGHGSMGTKALHLTETRLLVQWWVLAKTVDGAEMEEDAGVTTVASTGNCRRGGGEMPKTLSSSFATGIDGTILPRAIPRSPSARYGPSTQRLMPTLPLVPWWSLESTLDSPALWRGCRCCATCLATNGQQVYLGGKLGVRDASHTTRLVRRRQCYGRTHSGILCFDGGTPLWFAGSREDLRRPFPAYAEEVRAGRRRTGCGGQGPTCSWTRTRRAREDLYRPGRRAGFLSWTSTTRTQASPRDDAARLQQGSGARMLCELLGIDLTRTRSWSL